MARKGSDVMPSFTPQKLPEGITGYQREILELAVDIQQRVQRELGGYKVLTGLCEFTPSSLG